MGSLTEEVIEMRDTLEELASEPLVVFFWLIIFALIFPKIFGVLFLCVIALVLLIVAIGIPVGICVSLYDFLFAVKKPDKYAPAMTALRAKLDVPEYGECYKVSTEVLEKVMTLLSQGKDFDVRYEPAVLGTESGGGEEISDGSWGPSGQYAPEWTEEVVIKPHRYIIMPRK